MTLLLALLASCAPSTPDACDSGGCAKWCPDEDRDNYGAGDEVYAVSAPSGYAPCHPSDCDDDDAEVHPNAVEVCGEPDADCDPGTGGC
jgi:hypothetical protein